MNEPTGNGLENLVDRILEVNDRMQARLSETELQLQELSKLIESQAMQARTDSLTRLVNRRGFDEELDRGIREFQRHGMPCSLILLDLDHFKRVNDTHGHQTGDEVLRQVASSLLRAMRAEDLVCRYGGEEFAIILPHTPLADAIIAAERARTAVENAEIEFRGKRLSVTVSCGTAQPPRGEDAAILIGRADEALYAAKAAGRNNTHWHDGRLVHAYTQAAPPAEQRETEAVAYSPTADLPQDAIWPETADRIASDYAEIVRLEKVALVPQGLTQASARNRPLSRQNGPDLRARESSPNRN